MHAKLFILICSCLIALSTQGFLLDALLGIVIASKLYVAKSIIDRNNAVKEAVSASMQEQLKTTAAAHDASSNSTKRFKTVEDTHIQQTPIDYHYAGSLPPEVDNLLDYLVRPKHYQWLGAKMPRGYLFVGPPGTGKTTLARAIAQAAGCFFVYAQGSDFIEKYVGIGAQRIRELFAQAQQALDSGTYKAAIVFIDEIDAIGGTRNNELPEHTQTLNALLTEMDGFSAEHALIIIGATNRASSLDRALVRPGRFDRIVTVPLPDTEKRKAILAFYVGKIRSENIDIAHWAEHTDGFSAADLQALVNEATIAAAQADAPSVTHNYFELSYRPLRARIENQ